MAEPTKLTLAANVPDVSDRTEADIAECAAQSPLCATYNH
jgi:hypothetical protein